jgi:penicillin-binding protein 2
MLVTPIQLVNAIAAVAARGERFKPRLVRAIRNVTTGEVRELPPSKLPSVKVSSAEAWDYAIGGMVDVVNAPYGTARAMTVGAPYKIAGKSGTAQVFTVGINEKMRKNAELAEHLRDHALFVAFAPAEAPKIAVAVIVENAPRGGSAWASPIARRILDAYLLTPDQFAEAEAKRKAKEKAAPPLPEIRPGNTE